MRSSWSVTVTAALALAGCGAEPGIPLPAFVVIENASQYALEELRFHEVVQYDEAPNALAAPMAVGAVDARHMFGPTYVTVFREKYRGGEILALTTQQALTLENGTGYRVKVFDTAFRVVDEPYVQPAMTSSTSTTTGL